MEKHTNEPRTLGYWCWNVLYNELVVVAVVTTIGSNGVEVGDVVVGGDGTGAPNAAGAVDGALPTAADAPFFFIFCFKWTLA